MHIITNNQNKIVSSLYSVDHPSKTPKCPKRDVYSQGHVCTEIAWFCSRFFYLHVSWWWWFRLEASVVVSWCGCSRIAFGNSCLQAIVDVLLLNISNMLNNTLRKVTWGMHQKMEHIFLILYWYILIGIAQFCYLSQ